MIDKYLERGELFALYDEDLKSVCVVTSESSDTCELKNIATYEKWHGMGYGSKLIQYIGAFYKDTHKAMIVGTGDIPSIIQFYEKMVFAIPTEFNTLLRTTTTILFLKTGSEEFGISGTGRPVTD